MADTKTQPKRHIGETIEEEQETSKRHKYSSYNHLLSILEEEEEEEKGKSIQDLSAIFTSLQQELSSPCPSSSSFFDAIEETGNRTCDLQPRGSINDSCYSTTRSFACNTVEGVENHQICELQPRVSTADLCHSTTRSGACDTAQEVEPGPVSGTSGSKEDEENGDRESVIRHLLEASDDELGIPSGNGDEEGNGTDGADMPASLCVIDRLWELEDETANFYSLLHSELFM